MDEIEIKIKGKYIHDERKRKCGLDQTGIEKI